MKASLRNLGSVLRSDRNRRQQILRWLIRLFLKNDGLQEDWHWRSISRLRLGLFLEMISRHSKIELLARRCIGSEFREVILCWNVHKSHIGLFEGIGLQAGLFPISQHKRAGSADCHSIHNNRALDRAQF